MTPTPTAPHGGEKKSNTPLVIVLVVVGVLSLCCVVGVIAAIAVPNFMRFNSRAKQSEVKVNLKSAYVAEQSYFLDKNTYTASLTELGWAAGPNNRYLYALAADGELMPAGGSPSKEHTGVQVDAKHLGSMTNDELEKAVPLSLWKETGVQGECPDACSITIVGVGNLDTDSAVDLWSVSTKERVIDGVTVPPGQPHHHVDDLTE